MRLQQHYETVKFISSSNSTKPVSLPVAPKKIGSCNELHLDGSRSSSSDARSLHYEWKVIEGFRKETINSFLSSRNEKVVTIPSTLIEP